MSVILVGSLSNGSYTGRAGSDIDLIHILQENAPANIKNDVISAIETTEAETNNDIPISKCVYSFTHLVTPYADIHDKTTKDIIELPIEILRIKESGAVLFGKDICSEIRTPSREDVLKSFELSRQFNADLAYTDPDFFANYQRTVQNPNMRIMIQIVLTTAMSDLYFATGFSCSSKLKISECIKQNIPKYRFKGLLDLCCKWRYSNEEFTEDDEVTAKKYYRDWRSIREGTRVDFVPVHE